MRFVPRYALRAGDDGLRPTFGYRPAGRTID
jgi:hypothetical protein